MAEMTRVRMTAEEFKQLPETNLPTELIAGELIQMPSPEDLHQKLSMALIAFLLQVLPPGEFRHAPNDIYFDDGNVFQPDLFWVSSENTHCTVIDRYWHGAPDLVVEILSPGTERRDRKTKFDTYEKYGVREYWMLEAEPEYIEVWGLQDGKFVKLGVFGPGETFLSPVLGNKPVDVSAFFKK